MEKKSLPIVYACSGSSDIAQMANNFAVRLNKDGVAQMSCIAGVGGDIPALVSVAKSGRSIVAIDGCPLMCVKNCLSRHGVTPAVHFQLSDFGLKKNTAGAYNQTDVEAVFRKIFSVTINLQ